MRKGNAMNPKTVSLLGLAKRAGKLVAGEESCFKAIRSREAELVILAADASENTKKKYRDKCQFYRTPLIAAGDRRAIGKALGRAEQVAVAISDAGFARSIRASLENSEVETIVEPRKDESL